MKKKLALLIATAAFGIALTLPAIALAGGDQVQKPDECPQYQAVGEDPLALQLQANQP